MVVDVLVRPLRWVARAATGLVFAAAVILGAGLAAPAPAAAATVPVSAASAPASAASVSASVEADVADADETVAQAPARATRAQVAVDAPVTRPGDRAAVDRWQRPAPGQRGPPSGE